MGVMGDGHADDEPHHNKKLSYELVVLPTYQLPDTWQWWSETDDETRAFYAKGPCVACGGEVQGRVTDELQPIEGQGGEEKVREITLRTIDLPVACRCGYHHGHDGAQGCGRRWSIRGPRPGGGQR